MTDLDKQFAGNYVRLVNQCRDLQAELAISNKIIKKLMYDIQIFPPLKFGNQIFKPNSKDKMLEEYRKQAISELVAEQNKKATDNASI